VLSKENTMDAKTYCGSVGIELAGWKAKLYLKFDSCR
jgi:hypothetical protein